MQIKRIVLTTDLSEDSLRPCEPLAEFARQIGAKLTLLHVLQDLRIAPHGAPLAPAISSANMPEQAEAARGHLKELRETLPKDIEIDIDVLVHESIPVGIAEYAKEHDASMIAMSTHGRTGFRHLVLGSVAEAVLRHSPVPVLSFPRTQ